MLRIRSSPEPGGEPLVDLVGRELPGEWKWHGAVEDPETGLIYAIPQTADRVLRVAPVGCLGNNAEPVVDYVGPALPGRWKFYGGLYSAQGRAIYGIPACAGGVLRIGLPNGDVSVVGSVPEGGWKWHGGCVTPDGQVFGIPSNAGEVLRPARESKRAAPRIFRRIAARPRPRRGYSSDKSRRRRGCDVDISPTNRGAAAAGV